MIKLSFRFDVSFSKVILSVAGISASIGAFKQFILKNGELKSFSNIDFVQRERDSKKDNKVSNLISTKPTVKP